MACKTSSGGLGLMHRAALRAGSSGQTGSGDPPRPSLGHVTQEAPLISKDMKMVHYFPL